MRLATVYSFWLLAAPIRGRVFRAGVRVWGVGCVHLQELLINDCHEKVAVNFFHRKGDGTAAQRVRWHLHAGASPTKGLEISNLHKVAM